MILIFQSPFISPSKNIAQRKIAHEVLIRGTLLTFSGNRREYGEIKDKACRGQTIVPDEKTLYILEAPAQVIKRDLNKFKF